MLIYCDTIKVKVSHYYYSITVAFTAWKLLRYFVYIVELVIVSLLIFLFENIDVEECSVYLLLALVLNYF